ncbi:hypothetical protein LCGC14_1452850 [marine sediment metagenome]|uniref:J domain-containing protein n=1 Tax=marine sediment metagenome TaxID=412755 RepID=A0A0F9LXX7_9ZZZZ
MASMIQTDKTVAQTLADLRKVFSAWAIEDWEPVPMEQGPGYKVRYYRNKTWTEVGSFNQPTKSMNLRVCFQVVDNLRRWEARGVTGLIQTGGGSSAAFMGGALVATNDIERESYEEACATLGVEAGASVEEIKRVFQVKVQFAHPDKGGDPERFKRLNKAYEYILKVKGSQ